MESSHRFRGYLWRYKYMKGVNNNRKKKLLGQVLKVNILIAWMIVKELFFLTLSLKEY